MRARVVAAGRSGGGTRTAARRLDSPRRQAAPVDRRHGQADPHTLIHEAQQAGARPLDAETRARMQARFHYDFSQVRVHTDERAASAASAVDAAAYTLGRDIVFGAGRYAPGSPAGDRLLAHELTHVIQQGGVAAPRGQVVMGDATDATEREAERHAAPGAAGPVPAPISRRAGGVALQRQPANPPGQASGPAPGGAATVYQQALPKVKQLDARLFGFLSKAPLDGGPQEILRDVDPAQPAVSLVVRLNVHQAALRGGDDAQFNIVGGTPPATPGAPYVVDMEIAVSNGLSASSSSDALAQTLVHEGTHLQIAMDKIALNPSSRSPHAATFGQFQAAAKALASYENLTIFINNYIEREKTRLQMKTDEATRQKEARKIMDLIIEEKYVYLQDQARTGVGRSNARLALDYLNRGLSGVGIDPAPNLGGLLVDVEEFLDELDAKKPASPTPAAPKP
jgi:hypothetical protein